MIEKRSSCLISDIFCVDISNWHLDRHLEKELSQSGSIRKQLCPTDRVIRTGLVNSTIGYSGVLRHLKACTGEKIYRKSTNNTFVVLLMPRFCSALSLEKSLKQNGVWESSSLETH